MLNSAIEKRFTATQGKRVTIGEDTDVSRRHLQGVDGVCDRRSGWGNGHALLLECFGDGRSADGGFDGRRQLRAGRRHDLTVGQGHRCRSGGWGCRLLGCRVLGFVPVMGVVVLFVAAIPLSVLISAMRDQTLRRRSR